MGSGLTPFPGCQGSCGIVPNGPAGSLCYCAPKVASRRTKQHVPKISSYQYLHYKFRSTIVSDKYKVSG